MLQHLFAREPSSILPFYKIRKVFTFCGKGILGGGELIYESGSWVCNSIRDFLWIGRGASEVNARGNKHSFVEQISKKIAT